MNLSNEVLAERAWNGAYSKQMGVRYLRRESMSAKGVARDRLYRFLTGQRMPSLSILTIPSCNWIFERRLLQMREHGKGLWRPRRTHITSIEVSLPVYRASVLMMPGREHGSIVSLKSKPEWAVEACRTITIGRMFCGNVVDLMLHQPDGTAYDAAWIDAGKPTATMLDAVDHLWSDHLRSLLVLTFCARRYDAPINEDIALAGSLEAYLSQRYQGEVLDSYRYRDHSNSTMVQMVIRRPL